MVAALHVIADSHALIAAAGRGLPIAAAAVTDISAAEARASDADVAEIVSAWIRKNGVTIVETEGMGDLNAIRARKPAARAESLERGEVSDLIQRAVDDGMVVYLYTRTADNFYVTGAEKGRVKIVRI
jgi:hypothetical protein